MENISDNSNVEATVNVYSKINNAIDYELYKSAKVIALHKSQLEINRSKYALNITLICCSILITLFFIWWLFLHQSVSVNEASQWKGSPITQEERKRVEEIAATVKGKTHENQILPTKFTVFRASVTESGEKIVTGIVYQGINVSEPSSQYCYLELAGDINDLGGKELASIDEVGVLHIKTQDDFLKNFIKPHCLFVG